MLQAVQTMFYYFPYKSNQIIITPITTHPANSLARFLQSQMVKMGGKKHKKEEKEKGDNPHKHHVFQLPNLSSCCCSAVNCRDV